MKKSLFHIFVFISSICFAQDSLSELLKKYNTESVPYISVKELAIPKTDALLLDAREIQEYKVSHIKNATHVGYDDFEIERVIEIIGDKSSKIVVYCSLGVRSEDVAEQLKEAGYTNVFNLYGGIFEWKNSDLPVYDNKDKPTENVHAYSKNWSKWLKKGIKIYD